MSSRPLPVNWFIGTMGFSYEDWNGVFYPPEMKSQNYLANYSRVFNAVEIDSTFYGTPRQTSVARWRSVTPEGFRFCVKVPREITHDASLLGMDSELTTFIERITELGDKLGVILFQFPPSFHAGQLPALEATLERLPGELRFAVEVRHASWYTPKAPGHEPVLAETLRQYRVAWAATEYPDLPAAVFPTSPFLYLRWIGQHGTFDRHNEERIDRTRELESWLALIEQRFPAGEEIFGFFNNDYSGFAAATANRFKEIAGLPVQPFNLPQQPALF